MRSERKNENVLLLHLEEGEKVNWEKVRDEVDGREMKFVNFIGLPPVMLDRLLGGDLNPSPEKLGDIAQFLGREDLPLQTD